MIDDEDDCLENTDHNSTNNLDNISTVGIGTNMHS
jgi:hypothetical protein